MRATPCGGAHSERLYRVWERGRGGLGHGAHSHLALLSGQLLVCRDLPPPPRARERASARRAPAPSRRVASRARARERRSSGAAGQREGAGDAEQMHAWSLTRRVRLVRGEGRGVST